MRIILFINTCLLSILLIAAANADVAWQPIESQAMAGSLGAFDTGPTFLPVEEAYRPYAEFNSADVLRLNWQIAEGYYLYRDSLNFSLFDGARWLTLDTHMPTGIEQEDDYFGRSEVYRFQVDMAVLPIPAADDLYLVVTSQGCADAGLCYPPHQHTFQLNSRSMTVQPVSLPDHLLSAAALPLISHLTPPAVDIGAWLMMALLAMLGGVILNIMPCVFPVLSLKVLSFTQHTGRSCRLHGWAYTVGVLCSFVLVAMMLLILRAAGAAIGWGFQLQSPWFVAGLVYVFFVLGLSLSGVVTWGGRWMNMGYSLSDNPGYTGSFFTGMLATLVASPCTAPFMGAALGFAVIQTPLMALTIFIALGLGMALPVLLLSYAPRLLQRLPKPGPWMETFKQLLAFPLYATALWLAWVVGKQAGINAMGLVLVGCLLLALALWLWCDRRGLRLVSVVSIVLAFSVLGHSWLRTDALTNSVVSGQKTYWQTYTPELLAELQQTGQPILVNVTADWCITCLVNEKRVLSSQVVQQALRKHRVHYLKADWTRRAPEITELLTRFGRTGVPLYLVYPADGSDNIIVLPQLLTKTSVLAALAANKATVDAKTLIHNSRT